MLIVPVLEEQLVVQTRLILKEEIRISKKSRAEVIRQPVRLRSERVQVERHEGRDPDHSSPEQRSPTDDGTHPDGDL